MWNKTRNHIHCPECLEGLVELIATDYRQKKSGEVEQTAIYQCDIRGTCGTVFKRISGGQLIKIT